MDWPSDIGVLIAGRAGDQADAVAVDDQGRVFTYETLSRRAHQWARALRALGAGPEERLAIDLPRSAELLLTMVACLEAGVAYIPLDVTFPAARVQDIVRESGARWLVTEDVARAGTLAASITVLTPHDLARLAADRPARPLRAPVDPEHLAYVIYTSGSTGRPKGVAITRQNLANYLEWAAHHYPTHGGGTALFGSPAFDLSVTSLFLPWLHREPLIVYRGPDAFSDLADALASGRTFGFLKMTPSHLRLLQERLGDESPGPPPCGTLILGGESLSTQAVAWWWHRWPSTRIFNEYGPTETTVGSTVHEARPHEEAAAVPVGTAVANTAVYLADDDLRLAPVDAEGEIYIGGLGVARAYLGQPDLTAERFLPDPYSGRPGEHLYRTGDRARHVGADLYCLGRMDGQVKIAGHRLELSEVEAALRSCSSLRDAVMVTREAPDGTRMLVAVVVPADPADLEAPDALADRVCDDLARQLPAFMVPARVSVVPALPLTASGKLDHTRLDEGRRGGAGPGVGASHPETRHEATLVAIWSQVLGVPHVGIDDNFFSLGGDSMRSLQVRYKAAQRGLRFELKDLFEARTIRRLAARVTGVETPTAASPSSFALLADTDRTLLPSDVEDAYPMSRLQMGTLYHSSLPGQPGMYHNINSYRVQVAFDAACLSGAATRLAARHPILRTSYNLSDYTEPVQLVHATGGIPVEILDWRGWSEPRQRVALREWLDAEARRPFDWERPPLLRFVVHRLTDDELQFSVSKHHSILDGWSAASMVSELFNDYLAALGQGGQAADDAPRTRYRDFVALEQDARRSPEAKAFWRGRLHDFSRLRIGTGVGATPEPDFPSGSIVTTEIRVAPDVNARLVALAAATGVPLKAVLLAAHLKILSLASGQRDVVTGLVSNGRPETPDADRTLGLFLNSVPFRMRLGQSESWQALIERVFEEERQIVPFRRYPMPEIKRDLQSGVLFDTLFYFTNFHVFQQFDQQAHLKAIDFVGFEETEMRFTSAFNVHPLTKRLALFLHFRIADFGADQIAALGRCYARLLEDLSAGAERRHTDLVAVDRDEQRLQVRTWNGSDDDDAAADASSRDLADDGVVGEIERVAARQPDALAVRCGHETLTYGELVGRGRRVAGWVRAHGGAPDAVVGVGVARTIDTIVALLGVLRGGAAYVALDVHAPAQRLRSLVEEAGLTHVLTDRSSVASLSAALAGLCTVVDVSAVSRTHAPGRGVIDPDALAYLLFTSGSTGRPKGVMISHRNLAASTAARQTYYETPVTRFLLLSPLFFDSAVAGLFWTLTSGGCLVLPIEGDHREARQLARTCVEGEITHLLCIPDLYQALMDALGPSRAAMEVAIVAGEACGASLVTSHLATRDDVRLFNEYGPTEGTVWATVCRLDANAGVREARDPVPIGRPPGGLRAYLTDDRGHLLPIGAQGEILVGGSGVARGYWRQPSLTAARFVPNGWSHRPGTRAYRTGDRGRWRADGQMLFEGRHDHEVKIRGHRVNLEEIESLLREIPDVAAAAAVVDQRGALARVLAFVVLRDAAHSTGERVRAYLRGRLPAGLVPAVVSVVDALPALPTGKLDRRRLLEIQAPDAERARIRGRAPETAIERTVASAWTAVFGRADLDLDDDFFEIGGDSIVALQLTARLRAAFPVDLSVRDVFEARTMATLAAWLDDRAATGAEAARSARPIAADLEGARTWSSSDYAEASIGPTKIGSA